MIYVCYNNNTHNVLEVGALLESSLCKGFILSHFGRACYVGQHRFLIHNLTYAPLSLCRNT